MSPRPSIADRLPELVDAATAVFADKGYKATQMADVAAAADAGMEAMVYSGPEPVLSRLGLPAS